MWVDAPAAVLVLTAVAATPPALLSLVPHPQAAVATIAPSTKAAANPAMPTTTRSFMGGNPTQLVWITVNVVVPLRVTPFPTLGS